MPSSFTCIYRNNLVILVLYDCTTCWRNHHENSWNSSVSNNWTWESTDIQRSLKNPEKILGLKAHIKRSSVRSIVTEWQYQKHLGSHFQEILLLLPFRNYMEQTVLRYPNLLDTMFMTSLWPMSHDKRATPLGSTKCNSATHLVASEPDKTLPLWYDSMQVIFVSDFTITVSTQMNDKKPSGWSTGKYSNSFSATLKSAIPLDLGERHPTKMAYLPAWVKIGSQGCLRWLLRGHSWDRVVLSGSSLFRTVPVMLSNTRTKRKCLSNSTETLFFSWVQ